MSGVSLDLLLLFCFTVLNSNNCAIVNAEELPIFLSLVSTFEPFNTILITFITGGEIESISDCQLNVSFDFKSFLF